MPLARLLVCAAFALTVCAPIDAAVRWPTSAGNLRRRTDFRDVHFKLNAATARTVLSDGGDAAAVIQAALTSWNSLPNTALRFAALESTGAGIVQDGQNVIAFADTPDAINAVGGNVAVTVSIASADGTILETDIVLNPNVKYSSTLQAGTADLQAVITHELGHALGANHATVVSAAMFWKPELGKNTQALLQPDDAAFAAEVYPGPSANSGYGRIAGTATKDGQPLLGAGLTAVDPATGVTIGGLTNFTDGGFSMLVPVGNYLLFAAPITPLTPATVMYNYPVDRIDTAFKDAAAGAPGAPATLKVTAGSTVAATIATAGGASAIAISVLGKIVVVNGTNNFTLGAFPITAQSGQPLDFIAAGTGLDASVTEANILVTGAGATLRAGTLTYEKRITLSDGTSPLRFTVDIPPTAGPGAVTILITKGVDTALLAGGINVLPVKPSFTAASLVDAASSKGAGVAPGELISLYGSSVGPTDPTNNTGFDASTGALPTALGGISVTFDGKPAPMLYTSSGQLNLQVPYEVAGKTSTTVVVTNQGATSDPVTVNVLTAQPGIFLSPGTTQAIAVNADGNVNSTVYPAAKGTYVVFYCTGGGAVSPAVPSGKPAPASPLSFAQSASMTIGGMDAPIYQGAVLSPGFVGLIQVAAQIPAGAASGPNPVALTINGQTSATATVVVK